jgi:hypothetical protein
MQKALLRFREIGLFRARGGRSEVGKMDANEQIRVRQSQALRDSSTDVSASGGKAKVTERFLH